MYYRLFIYKLIRYKVEIAELVSTNLRNGTERLIPQNTYFAESGVPFRSVPQISRHPILYIAKFVFVHQVLMRVCVKKPFQALELVATKGWLALLA